MKRQERHVYSIVILMALALTAIVYAPMFAGKIPFPADFIFDFPPFAHAAPPEYPSVHTNIGDLVTSFYPYHTLAARAAHNGELPLWNPYMLSGAPFLANTQSALFYPPNFLYYVLPVPAAWSIGFVLRRLLAAMFTALFVRKIGGSATGATVSGLLFAFCGFLTAWQGQAMSDAGTWLPLICYSVVRLRSDPSARSVGLAAFAFAMPALAGHPETAAHVTLTGLGLMAFLLAAPEPNTEASVSRLAFTKCFVAAGLLALGMAAVQVLPTAEWLKYIHRPPEIIWPPLPPWSLVSLVSRDIIRSPNSAGLVPPEHAGYIGLLAFVAVPLALFHSSRRIMIFFALWSAAAISVAYGIGPIFWFVQHVPGLNTLKNTRLMLIFSFGVAILAGLGISALETIDVSRSRDRRFRALMLAGFGLSIGSLLVYVLHLQVHVMANEIVEFVRVPKFSLFLLLAAAVPVVGRLIGTLALRPFRILVLAVVALDLCTVSYRAIPFTRPRDIFPSIELFERLPKNTRSPFRIAQLGYAYGANFELMYGLRSLGGYEIALERMKTFLADLSRDELDSVMLTTTGVLETKDRRIDMLNAQYYIVSEWDPHYLDFRNQPDRFRYLFTFGDTDVLENVKSLPAASLVPATGIEVIADETAQLNRVKDPAFDPERHVVLAEAPADSIPASPTGSENGESKVEWISNQTNSFELDVSAGEPSILVASLINYPGWKAYIDGRQAAIIPANYALPSISVSPGPHRIRFSFEPLSFRIGLLLSLASSALVTAIVIRRGQRKMGS